MGPSQFAFSWHSPHENKYNFMSENKGAPYGEKFLSGMLTPTNVYNQKNVLEFGQILVYVHNF